MSEIDTGGMAFPGKSIKYVHTGIRQEPVATECFKDGMTLLDYFAAKAMLGILQARVDGLHPEDLKNVAQDSYLIAQAMLAEKRRIERSGV